jgi:hypothetical protein
LVLLHYYLYRNCTLTAGATSVNEGSTATFSLATTNVPAGTNVAYTITGVNAADVDGALTGTALVDSNGKATISVKLLNDLTTEGAETVTVSLDNGRANAATTVADTSLSPVYTVAAGAATANEGSTVTFTVTADTAVTGSAPVTITGISAADVETLPTTVSIVDGKGTISLVLKADATTEGAETISVKVGNSTATTTVSDTSMTPVLGTDSANGTVVSGQGTAIITPATILANDIGSDGKALAADTAITIVSGSATNGEVFITKDGNYLFVANSGARTGSFKYTVAGQTGEGTVNVTLNAAPVVTTKDLTVNEDESVDGTVTVTDADNDTITYTYSATNGTVTDNGEGKFSYKGNANYNGSDTITVKVSDGYTTETKSIAVTVAAVNDAPTVVSPAPATVAVNSGSTVTVDLSKYATDVDSASLTYSAGATTTNGGTISISGSTATITYAQGGGSSVVGADSFKISATDGTTTLSDIAVNLNVVNTAPAANSFSVSDVKTGVTYTVDLTGQASDAESNTLTPTVVIGSLSNGGSAEVKDGKIVYTSTVGFTGTETLKYTVADGFGGTSGQGTITFTVSSNTGGTSGNDLLYGSKSAEVIDGLAGNDTIVGGGGADTITGGDGNDTITFDDAAPAINGGAGSDTLVINGNALAATFDLSQTGDQNTDGNSTTAIVRNFENIDATKGASGFTLTADNADTTSITTGSSADTLTFTNATGTSITVNTNAGNDTINIATALTGTLNADAGDGNDTYNLNANTLTHTLKGGAGNDTFNASTAAAKDNFDGGAGNDTFIYATAALVTVDDTIVGGEGTDRLRIDQADTSFSTSGLTKLSGIEEYVINDESANGGETLTITNDAFGGSVSTVFVGAIDKSVSATTMDRAFTLVTSGVTSGTVAVMGTGTVTISNVAGSKVSVKDGVNGDINLGTLGQSATGGTGNDTITGNTGNDTIAGGAGNDVFDDFQGNDSVDGGAGNDLFITTTAANITAADSITGGEGTDRLRIDEEASFSTSGLTKLSGIEEYVINDESANGGETLTITNDAFGGSVSTVFVGAIDLSASATTMDKAFTLVTKDVTSGSVAVMGTGLVTISNDAGSKVSIKDGVNGNIDLGTGGQSATGGTGNDTITGNTGNDTISGGAGNDVFDNLNGNDSIDGGAGNDTFSTTTAAHITSADSLTGGEGTDRLAILEEASFSTSGLTKLSGIEEYIINDESANGGETLTITNDAFGGGVSTVFVGAIDLSASATTMDKAFTLVTSGVTSGTVAVMGTGTVTISNVAGSKVSVKDGVNGDINLGAGGQSATGGTGNDTITGGTGNDTVSGGAGNDTFDDFQGDDSVNGGAGNDTFTVGTNLSAGDTIDGGADTDTMTITLSSAVLGAATITNVETITINTGSNQTGTFNATNVSSSTAIKLEEGGTADNAVSVTNLASGMTLTIQDVGGVTGGADFTDNVTLSVKDESTGTADSLTVNINSEAAFGLTTSADLETLSLVVGALANQDLSSGSNIRADKINVSNASGSTKNLNLGTVGNDVTTVDANSFSGGLTVTTGTGAQTITGGSGADVLDGGAGNDSVNGGAGNDTITIDSTGDVADGGTGTDTLTVNFTGVGGAIIIDLSATDQVTSMNGQANSAVQSNFENVNVSAYNNSSGADITGSSGANSITGTNRTDVINGSEGADTIVGGAGIDTVTLTETTSAADNVVLYKTATAGNVGDYDDITGFTAGTDNIVTLDTEFALFNGTSDGVVTLATGATLDGAGNANATVYTISTNVATHTFATFLAGTSTIAQLEGAIGTALGAATDATFAAGDKFIVAIDDGTHTGIIYVESGGSGNVIADTELSVVGILRNVSDATALVAGDFLFS